MRPEIILTPESEEKFYLREFADLIGRTLPCTGQSRKGQEAGREGGNRRGREEKREGGRETRGERRGGEE